ncbi:succinyl-diaminopimelate desuccinylase [Staphylococcus auricularis]|uniref:ArgE/DapE family deacylase n=1 Tax=Staphylococcus auricularis TaxID=29379 RepID=UPI001931EA7F|nr:ArgE/DapE family deacylase [Staphylococcus auricularis]MBM0869086.1 ArgE/DapE family deacylase [Staphylococcus auricularis]MCG7340800.1 ArgE/DapE family deacylase [Staphylococcus auricularis]
MSLFSEAQKLQFLEDLILIDTVNHNELEVCRYLQQLLSDHNIEAKIIELGEHRANLVAEIGEEGPVLGISGHMDVVSPGDHDKWTYDPFKLTEMDGKLYGRGTADMKAGLLALVLSLIEIHDQNLLHTGRIRLLATTGEEIVGEGAKAFQQQGYMNDVEALIIAEPSQDRIIYAHRGSMDIRITSRGHASHSSMPELGFNAITPLIQFIHDVNDQFSQFDQQNDLLGHAIMNNTLIKGGEQVNSIPAYAEAEFNIRTIPEHDNEQFITFFKDVLSQIETEYTDLEMDAYMSRLPVYTTGHNQLVELAIQMGEKYLNTTLPSEASPGVTDASDLLLDKGEGFPFIMFGPGTMDQAHQVDEHIEKSAYFTFIDLFTEMLPTYLEQLNPSTN